MNCIPTEFGNFGSIALTSEGLHFLNLGSPSQCFPLCAVQPTESRSLVLSYRKVFSIANKARKAIKRMKDVHDAVSSNNNNKKKKKDKHHRRDLGGIDEELLGRECDILDERDYLD